MSMNNDLEQWVQVSSCCWHSQCIEVVVLELLCAPGTTGQHLTGQLSRLLLALQSKLGALADLVRLPGAAAEAAGACQSQ